MAEKEVCESFMLVVISRGYKRYKVEDRTHPKRRVVKKVTT